MNCGVVLNVAFLRGIDDRICHCAVQDGGVGVATITLADLLTAWYLGGQILHDLLT